MHPIVKQYRKGAVLYRFDRCKGCGAPMEHSEKYERCAGCTVPRREGESERAYRRRANEALGIHLRSDGRAYGAHG